MLTPAERRRLVEAPFPIVVRHCTSYPHAGTLIDRNVDDEVALRRKFEREEALVPVEIDNIAFAYNTED